MSKLSECISNITYIDGGIPISGHTFTAALAIYDIDTDRTYHIASCSTCGRYSVSWQNGEGNLDGRCGFTYKVGGPDE